MNIRSLFSPFFIIAFFTICICMIVILKRFLEDFIEGKSGRLDFPAEAAVGEGLSASLTLLLSFLGLSSRSIQIFRGRRVA